MIIDLCSDDDGDMREEQKKQGVEKEQRNVSSHQGRDEISSNHYLPLQSLTLPRNEHNNNQSFIVMNLSQEVEEDAIIISSEFGRTTQPQNPTGKKRKNNQQQQISAEEARANKNQSKIQAQQRYGYYKHQEFSLNIEENLFNSELGGELKSHLLFSSENKPYGYFSMSSPISGLCQWSYRSYLDGGNGAINEVGVIPLPFVVIHYPSQQFLQLVLQSQDGITFNEYSQELNKIRSQLSSQYHFSSQQIKILITLIGIHEECVLFQRQQRKTRSDPSSTATSTSSTSTPSVSLPLITQRLDEVIAYSLYHENVEICCRKNSSEFCVYMTSLTKVLGEQIYSTEKSSFDSFKRLPIRPIDPTGAFSPQQKLEHEMSQIWINMLQMIPGVSKSKAEQFASHFPSLPHLLEALHDPSLSQEVKLNNLQETLSSEKNKNIKYKKLSKLIYLIFTTNDPSTSLQI